LLPGTALPPDPPDLPPRPTWLHAARRRLSDLRAGRAFLASELSRPGWLDFGAFRWHDIAIRRGARVTLGVITPLAIGVATGHAEYGSFAALGALPAGFVAFRGVTRSRVLAVTLAAVGMAVSTFVGAVTQASDPRLLVAVIFVWAYAAGLLAALGPTALAVCLQWPVALLIASALPLRPADAAFRALLVLAGGLWQGVLVVTSWTVGRGSAERTAVAQSFQALARYAADLAAGSREPPPPQTLAGQRALGDPNPLLRSQARLHLIDLNEEAERIRATLTALSTGQPPGSGPDVSLLTAAESVLDEISDAVAARPASRAEHLTAARRQLAGLSGGPTAAARQWAGAALLGQLRAACRITGRLNNVEPASTRHRRAVAQGRPSRQDLSDVILTLRASMSVRSEAGRHALRLAVVTAVGEVIVTAADLPHGYWGVLTIFIVLRPDYSSTLYRGLQRAAGTVLGVGLGVLTVLIGRLGDGVLLGGIAVSLLAAYAVFTVNYLLYAVFLTDFVVVLLALLGLPPDPTAVARLAGTGIGTGLALIAYLVWPTWEVSSATEKFARIFAAQGSYARLLLRAYTRPDDPGRARRTELQVSVRRARTDIEASTDRLAGEPDHPQMTADLARSLTSAAYRIAQASITLAAAVTVHQAAPDPAGNAVLQPHLDELGDGVDTATAVLARTLREQAAAAAPVQVPALPPLRAQQQALAAVAADPGSAPADDADEAVGLVAATDSLVDAINTAADTLRRHDGQVTPPR
jgi:uncharacterized membrane protein YccC